MVSDPALQQHSAFLSGALLTAIPGIIAQLILIPLILTALQKANFID